MDIRKVKKLIELLEESDINEIEIKEGEESVRISRASPAMLVAAAAAPAGLGLAPEGVPAGAGACESGFRATYGLRTALPCTPVSPTLSTICRPGSGRNTLQADLRPCRSVSACR